MIMDLFSCSGGDVAQRRGEEEALLIRPAVAIAQA
jgi:hypothetical protein